MTCPSHRPRPAGPPRLQPSGFVDTVMRCAACGEVSVRSEWRGREARYEQAELPGMREDVTSHNLR